MGFVSREVAVIARHALQRELAGAALRGVDADGPRAAVRASMKATALPEGLDASALITPALTNQQHSHDCLREPATVPLPDKPGHPRPRNRASRR